MPSSVPVVKMAAPLTDSLEVYSGAHTVLFRLLAGIALRQDKISKATHGVPPNMPKES